MAKTTQRRDTLDACDRLIGAAQVLEAAAERLRHEAREIRKGFRVHGWQGQPGYDAHLEWQAGAILTAADNAREELGVVR